MPLCCAYTANGQPTTVPPKRAINSRRFIPDSPKCSRSDFNSFADCYERLVSTKADPDDGNRKRPSRAKWEASASNMSFRSAPTAAISSELTRASGANPLGVFHRGQKRLSQVGSRGRSRGGVRYLVKRGVELPA
jgi:hypothetical protein